MMHSQQPQPAPTTIDGIPCGTGNEARLRAFDSEGTDHTGGVFADYACRNAYLERYFTRAGAELLDLAGGDGYIAEHFRATMRVALFDGSIAALRSARDRRGITDLFAGFVEEPLPYTNARFDYVFWGDNIEHIYHPHKVLLEIARVLKKDGLLLLSFPNAGHWFYRMYYLIRGTVKSTEPGISRPWLCEHIRFYNAAVVMRLLRECGFAVRAVLPVVKGRYEKIDRLGARLLPTLFGEDLLLVATPLGKE